MCVHSRQGVVPKEVLHWFSTTLRHVPLSMLGARCSLNHGDLWHPTLDDCWGLYPTPTNKDIYEATLKDIYKATAVAQGEGAQLMILSNINIDLNGVTNPQMDLLHGTLEGQDGHCTSTISMLSSLGVEDIGRQFLQCKRMGIWTWGQVCQGKQIRSVSDYILMDPEAKVLSHRIRCVPGCSTDHQMVYMDIPHGNLKIHHKKKWGLQKWPLAQSELSYLDRTFDMLMKADTIPTKNG